MVRGVNRCDRMNVQRLHFLFQADMTYACLVICITQCQGYI